MGLRHSGYAFKCKQAGGAGAGPYQVNFAYVICHTFCFKNNKSITTHPALCVNKSEPYFLNEKMKSDLPVV
jgi:hypothetical protein